MADISAAPNVAVIFAADATGINHVKRLSEDAPRTVDVLKAAGAVFVNRIEANHGRVVQMADVAGFKVRKFRRLKLTSIEREIPLVLAHFSEVAGAFLAALQARAELIEWDEALPINFSVGIDLRKIEKLDDETVPGDAANVALGLVGIDWRGDVLVSRSVFDNAPKDQNLSFGFLGDIQLKHSACPVGVYRVLDDSGPNK